MIIFFTSFFILQFTYSVLKREEYLALFSFIYLYYPYHALKIYRYSKPIFVYYNGKLHYTKEEKTYEFENYTFEIEFSNRHNYSGSLIIYDARKSKLVIENKWYIKNNCEIDEIVKKLKLLKLLSQKKTIFGN